MSRAIRVVLIACLISIGAASPASASGSDPRSSLALSALWSKIFETPSDRNPFGTGGDAYGCLTLAPGLASAFGAEGIPACTFNPGTTLVVTPTTTECSTPEGTKVPDLRGCATAADADVTAVALTIDGRAVPTTHVQTGFIPIILGRNNIFTEPAGTVGLSVADGWITIVRPFAAGTTHTIFESSTRTDSGIPTTQSNTTVITIRP